MIRWINCSESLPDDGVDVFVKLSAEGQISCGRSYVIAQNNYCDGDGLWMTEAGWLKDDWVDSWMGIPK